ncbi:MAG: oxidoreductase [Lachnospiraceae bacterium]|nr:oxidoreductase [Lachnospiraceae bacterium]
MEKKAFKDGISLSRLGMGNMRLPIGTGGDKDIDYAKAQEIIDYGMSHGINYYDTAYVYHEGESERFVGKALSKYDRDSYYIATKFSSGASRDYKKMFEEQLEKLGTDHVDFYLLHAVMNSNVDFYLTSGCIEYFLEQKEKGRIKYFGFSSHADPDQLERIANHHQWDFAQIQVNYFDWKYSTTQEEYKILKDRNIPIVVMEPVRGGKLATLSPEAAAILKEAHPDWSIASWALRFVRSLDQVQVILSGMSNMEQIEDNVATFDDETPLSEADQEVLFKALDVFHNQLVVPCTACRYCTPDCPMNINIPEWLNVYNKYKTDGPWEIKGMLEHIESEGKPADCIGCGSCVGHCPQNIQTPEIMQELAKVLEQ